MNERRPIPFHTPTIGDEFEEDFRAYTGASYALAVNSCTAAMHLALAGLRVGPGDEVITSAMTFCATVNCIIHVGATPVLADIGDDGNIDPRSIADRITSRTRAIMPVHYGGAPCDMDAIWRLARRYDLRVVEDAAHAAGTFYHGEHLGSAKASKSDAVAYSFYATKNLTTGEGGMVTTNNEELLETMRCLALHGINKDAWNRYAASGKWFYSVDEPGFKYNLTDIASAIGIHQLRRLEEFAGKRAHLVKLYNRLFQGVAEVETPADTTAGRHAWHLYVLRLNLERLTITRDEFIEALRQQGIGTSVHFIPIQMHAFYAPWANRPEQKCPRSLAFFQRVISLPLHPGLTDEDVFQVAEAVKRIAAANARPHRASHAAA
jgi:dTDP-4-amino-4,6-dideoxygalactose transaminase